MPYLRFTKVIIYHFMSKHNSISNRQCSPYHTIDNDGVLNRLKFVSKGEIHQVYRKSIPDTLITDDIHKKFISLSTCLIPPKIGRGKGAQGSKATIIPKKERAKKIEYSEEESGKQEERLIRKNLEVPNKPPGKSIVLDEGAGTSPEVPDETKDKSKAHNDLDDWCSTNDETFLFDDKDEKVNNLSFRCKIDLEVFQMKYLLLSQINTMMFLFFLKPNIEDEDEDPEKDEFEEEEDPQEEEEDDMEIDIEEDENEPDPIEHEDETVPASVHEVGESFAAPFLREDSNGLFLGLMRRYINSLFDQMASISRRLCGREMAHALVEKNGKVKDKFYGKLILELGNEVRSSVDQGTAAMEKLVEKLGNAEDKVECKKLKKELAEARIMPPKNDASGSGRVRGRDVVHAVQECTFAGFMKCNPAVFHGVQASVELRRWFEKTKSVFEISKYAEGKKIKFVATTLEEPALNWWKTKEFKEARGRAYAIKDAEPHGLDVVTGTFLLNNRYAFVLFDSGFDKSFVDTRFSAMFNINPIKIGAGYEVELADGRVASTNTILNGCTLNMVNLIFEIDLMPIELGTFNVIIGMDWLVKHDVIIVCGEKVVLALKVKQECCRS
uniref:Reverse transcriptase domain-containing protein n=1 Tax=Tanacetum cinerariifolium TaxID=118510 RepID=A0A6L2JMC4_TANCI|nr:reverse transcriptase domain-containing protein [Tanacetum cinerariifolium]